MNQLEVLDDLSINRWLMRIMRLGGGTARCSGSSGYGQNTNGFSSALTAASARRRKSAVESNMLGAVAGPSSPSFLRPPVTARARRFSDSLNLLAAQRASKSRKGNMSQRRR
jgi:hypothetical protein